MTDIPPSAPTRRDRLRAFLARRAFVRYAVAAGVLLVSPSLFYGFVMDDRLQRDAALEKSPLYHHGPFDMFSFVPGNRTEMLRLMDRGFGPWWSDTNARIDFLRPVSSALMWFDYRYVGHPVLVHAHSLVWFASTIALASALYRRWIPTPWVAGLATLMFAIDPAHGLLAGWIAQRNALVAGLFGLGSLALHDRSRRDGRPLFAALASLSLGLALFSAEAALGVLPYFLAHAWYLDGRRLRSLLPLAPPILLWLVVYKLGRHGAHGSGLYVDPTHQPGQYAKNVVVDAPLLVATELGFPASDFYLFLPTTLKVAIVGVSAALSAAFVIAMRPLFVRDATTRFFVVGALLSLLPACAVFPGARLLFFVGFGVLGALAQLAGARHEGVALRGSAPMLRFALPFHLYVAPFLLVCATAQMKIMETILVRAERGIPDVPEVETQRLVVVNPFDAAFLGYLTTIRSDRGAHPPGKVLALAAGIRPLELTRTSETTLVLSSPVALVQPGTDLLVHDTTPFVAGTRVMLTDVTVEIVRVDADGWPTEARFEFARPLEDPSLRFMQWQGTTLVPFPLPAVGERVAFAPLPLVQL